MDDEQIECLNCGVTPSEIGIELPIYDGIVWYCSHECYDEKTRDEG